MTGLIERWRAWLPVTQRTPVISLEEGGTPLIRCPGLERIVGNERQVFVKYEGANPTGSFKDRGMTLAISKALEEGCSGILCASTGNTSASAAAYAARAQIPCFVVLPAGQVASGKLAQAVVHGARIIPIEGNFDTALELVLEVAGNRRLTLVNSLNPYRIQGQKTVAFEIAEALGRCPDAHFLPVGNAGNITATWLGYRELAAHPTGGTSPRMMGYQASGAAPIVRGAPVPNPETLATAIRIGNPASWTGATEAAAASHGVIEAVTDEQILGAYLHLARVEGVFCEPSSAAGVAGLLERARTGDLPVPPGGIIVCTLTGNGLKAPETAMAGASLGDAIPATLAALQSRMDDPN
ncbi:MAG: threonine synthase [Planctomycetota bacterium]